MQKIFILLFGIMLLASPVLGDEVDDGLPQGTSPQVRLSAREMAAAGVPADVAAGMTRRMMENRFRQEQIIRAHRTVMAALKEGLPQTAVINKANEGMVKKASAEAVLQAMENTRSRYSFGYRQAREIARQEREVRQIGNLIADSLAAGVLEPDVLRTMEQLRERERTRSKAESRSGELAVETFQALRSMTRLGVSGRTAAEVVCRALEQRFSEREMNSLQQAFMKGSLQGAPEKLAHQYVAAIGRGERADDLGGYSVRESGAAKGGAGDRDGSGGGMGGSDGSGGSGHGGGAGGPGGR